ncbi:DUF1566 domain-containing protein, partial [bacterium]|nr:DUF1566 domain-containing protein [bacterium]
TYYIRAYATNLQGTAYGNEVTLNFNAVPAAVTTNSVSNIDATTATLNGNITAIGDPAYTEKGFVYSKTPNPTTSNNKVKVSGSGSGTFTYNLTGLETQVTYYAKAYVISNNNVRYGSEVSFYTESPYYYVLKSAGLMVQKSDLSTSYTNWSSANTMANSSTAGGFSDWRLPTIDELSILYQNRNVIGGFQVPTEYNTCEGTLPIYWSSTSGSTSGTYKIELFNETGGIDDFDGTKNATTLTGGCCNGNVYTGACYAYVKVYFQAFARAVRTIH